MWWSIAYFVYITTKVSDHQYDLGIKGQGKIYLLTILIVINDYGVKMAREISNY